MPQLKLISIYCRETEDWTGADEALIKVNGNDTWRGSLNDRQSKSLSSLPLIPFSSTARIELFDEDAGGPDNADFLGSVDVQAFEAGQGEKYPKFTEDGANYTITYEVVA